MGAGVVSGACVSVLAFAGVARAETPDAETAQFMCDLTGDCGDSSNQAAAPTASAPPPTGGSEGAVKVLPPSQIPKDPRGN